MPKWLHRTTKQFLRSVPSGELPEPQALYIEEPDLSAVIDHPKKYWKITGNVVSTTEKTSSEKTTDGDQKCVSLGCSEGTQFVGSKNSDIYHKCHCSYAKRILEENLVCFSSKQEAIEIDYRAAKRC